MFHGYSWPLTISGIRGEDFHPVENLGLSFDSTAGPSHRQIQPMANRKEYFPSAVGNENIFFNLHSVESPDVKCEENLCINGQAQLKLVLFTVQLYFQPKSYQFSRGSPAVAPLGPGFWL